jgi:hypothetical protein
VKAEGGANYDRLAERKHYPEPLPHELERHVLEIVAPRTDDAGRFEVRGIVDLHRANAPRLLEGAVLAERGKRARETWNGHAGQGRGGPAPAHCCGGKNRHVAEPEGSLTGYSPAEFTQPIRDGEPHAPFYVGGNSH